MWNTVVSTADMVFGRLALGFLNVSSDHPIFFLGGAAVLLGLTLTVWVDLLNLRLDTLRSMPGSEPERVIKLRR